MQKNEPNLAVDQTRGMGMLSRQETNAVARYRRAVNYLAAGQIYLRANPILEELLKPEHLKPRLLGHWGTCPGINLIYVHLNRLILRNDATSTYIGQSRSVDHEI